MNSYNDNTEGHITVTISIELIFNSVNSSSIAM